MAGDKRTWAKIDLGYLDNPKMSDVLDASSNAPLMHLASILHCAQHLTDGHVSSKAMQRKVGGDASDTQALLDAGLWHEEGHDCSECPEPEPGKVYVHNYLNHNVSSGKVEKLSERGKKAAEARWAKEKVDAPSNATCMQSAMQDDSKAVQSAMPDREIDREIERERTSEVSAETPRPDVERILEAVEHHCRQHDLKKPNRTKQNLAAARLLIDRDGYTVNQVLWIMAWVSASEFWASNIRSAAKLREKFDQLKHQATRQTSSGTSRPSPAATRQAETVAMIQELQAEENARQTTPRSEGSIMGEIL